MSYEEISKKLENAALCSQSTEENFISMQEVLEHVQPGRYLSAAQMDTILEVYIEDVLKLPLKNLTIEPVYSPRVGWHLWRHVQQEPQP